MQIKNNTSQNKLSISSVFNSILQFISMNISLRTVVLVKNQIKLNPKVGEFFELNKSECYAGPSPHKEQSRNF